jgi:hypothetical protein
MSKKGGARMKAHITKEPTDICEYYTQDCDLSFLATVLYITHLRIIIGTHLVLVKAERNIKDVV